MQLVGLLERRHRWSRPLQATTTRWSFSSRSCLATSRSERDRHLRRRPRSRAFDTLAMVIKLSVSDHRHSPHQFFACELTPELRAAECKAQRRAMKKAAAENVAVRPRKRKKRWYYRMKLYTCLLIRQSSIINAGAGRRKKLPQP
jgi:hypothetical protein